MSAVTGAVVLSWEVQGHCEMKEKYVRRDSEDDKPPDTLEYNKFMIANILASTDFQKCLRD